MSRCPSPNASEVWRGQTFDRRNLGHAVSIPDKSRERTDRHDASVLAVRMAQGDLRALDEAYRRHADEVYSAVVRITGSADAGDVTHDAFLRAFERAHQFHGTGELGGWIRTIAVNLALQQVRTRKRHLGLLARRWRKEPVLAHPAAAEAIELERAIADLPDTLRLAFLLIAVEGRTHEDVAAHLNISVSASRKRYQRAREALGAKLRDDL